MYCKNCNEHIDDNASFCPYCGESVNNEEGLSVQRKAMFCKSCGERIETNVSFCPHCGYPTNSNMLTNVPKKEKRQRNVMCIVGFVVSFIGLFLDFLGLMGIIGVVLSIVGLVQANRNNEKGKVMATFGILFGVFIIIYRVISLLVLQDSIAGLLD